MNRRKCVRVVEGARLERVYAGNRIGGSNPLASAIFYAQKIAPKGDFLLFDRNDFDN